MLLQATREMGWLIGLIIGALIFAVIGNAVEKGQPPGPGLREGQDRFFIQNQLGMIISIIAFCPWSSSSSPTRTSVASRRGSSVPLPPLP